VSNILETVSYIHIYSKVAGTKCVFNVR